MCSIWSSAGEDMRGLMGENQTLVELCSHIKFKKSLVVSQLKDVI